MIQRLIYAWTIVYLYNAPYIQIALTSVVSYGMLFYLIRSKPFETRVNNIVTIFTEICIFITLSGIGAFLIDRVEGRIREIVDYSLSLVVVIAVSVPVIVGVIQATKSCLEKCKRSSEDTEASKINPTQAIAVLLKREAHEK
jgi:hypothetical protein